jgi:putative protease
VQTIKLDFNKALEEANQSFAACGGAERHPLADKTYLIEEGSRPGELMPIIEDEHGTYIMNSKDLRAVEQVEKLVKIGVDSLKIEGRTKSLYYVARTAQVYRQAIDDAVAGRPFDLGLLAELEGLANRGYTRASWNVTRPRITRTTWMAIPRPSKASMWAMCWKWMPMAGR